MEAFTMLSLAALVLKIVTVIKSVGKDNNMALTQALVWLVGIVIITLAAHAKITMGITPIDGGPSLGDFDFSSIVLAGLSLGSVGSFGRDVIKSRDNTDSADEPPLFPSLVPPAKPVGRTGRKSG